MIDKIIDFTLKNGVPTSKWWVYILYIGGVFGIIVLFSAIVLIVSWVKKRKVEPSISVDE